MKVLVKFKDTDFLHASARIRTAEKNLLSSRQLLQMVDAPTLEEAYKIAGDAGLDTTIPVEEFERAIAKHLDETYDFLESLVTGHDFLRLLRYEYDALNLKTLIKAKALERDPADLLTDLGSIPVEILREEFRQAEYERTPAQLGAAAIEAEDVLARTNDPQLVDVILDKAMLAAMLEKALGYDIPMLHELVRQKIDLANLSMMVRIARIGKDADFFKRALAPGGALKTDAMIDAFPKGMDAIVAMIAESSYGSQLEPALADLRTGGSLTLFERISDNCRLPILRKSRLVPFGVEVLVVFAVAKDMELRAVRIVLASRLAQVAPDLIKERLRETYA